MSIKKMPLLRVFLVLLLCPLVEISAMTSGVNASVKNSSLLRSDVNGDGIVNILDLGAISTAWNSNPGNPRWDPRADLNDDGSVNIVDMVLAVKDLGLTWIFYDFDEPLDWNVVSGTWNTVNGVLEGFSNTEGMICSRNKTWEDCTLTAKVKIAADSPRAEAAFCVGFVDSGNFYWAGLGCWGHRVSISKMVDHVPEELAFSGVSADIVKDVWYNVSIEISGDAIMLYVNDVLESVVNDSFLTGGGVGVRLWNSHILVDYVTVSGSKSAAKSQLKTKSEIYRGFVWSPKDFIQYESLSREHFKKVRSWGFNCILIPVWWSEYVEPDEDAVGVYDEGNLQALRNSVDLALNEGLKVILSGRVCFDPAEEVGWDGWATHDYVNMQDEGLNRYAKFWEMVAQRFPDCMYCLWHFPYHMQSVDSTRKNRFYSVTFPTLLSAVRKYSNNEVIFVPIHQNPKYYLTGSPINDEYIIYGVGHAMPWEIVDYGNWDYNTRYFDDWFAGINRWRETYNLSLMSVEYGALRWKKSEPIDQSRLDCLNESLRRMNMYDVGWMYWWLTLSQTTNENIIDDIVNFDPKREIFTILQSSLG